MNPEYLSQDWQSNKSVVERNKYMFEHKLACDVTFLVGPGRTPVEAHKYVLISSSPVFYAMFIGPCSAETGHLVNTPDIDVETFNQFLQYLYCDKLIVDGNNVLAILYLAKKYCVQKLITQCLNVLKKDLSHHNVCTVMECAHRYGYDNMMSECIRVIQQDPATVFGDEDFFELCADCLARIIKDDELPIEEEKLFKIIWEYGKKKCETRKVEPSSANIKTVLGDVIHHIRFPLMSEKFYKEEVIPSGIIPDNETVPLNHYVTTPRKFIYTVQRFCGLGPEHSYKRYNADAICFTCSHNLLIHGIQIYGCSQGGGELKVILKLEEGPSWVPMSSKHKDIKTDGKTKTYDIHFDKPVMTVKDKVYCFHLVISGAATYSGKLGLESVTKGEVTFTFTKSDRSSNNTTPTTGQIPGIIYEQLQDGHCVIP